MSGINLMSAYDPKRTSAYQLRRSCPTPISQPRLQKRFGENALDLVKLVHNPCAIWLQPDTHVLDLVGAGKCSITMAFGKASLSYSAFCLWLLVQFLGQFGRGGRGGGVPN